MKTHCTAKTLRAKCERLAKRRRPLLESNPPRNSQPETHPDDERGCLAARPAPPSVERFPDASKNSCNEPPRNGLLFLFGAQFPLELHRGAVIQRRVHALFVVGVLEVITRVYNEKR